MEDRTKLLTDLAQKGAVPLQPKQQLNPIKLRVMYDKAKGVVIIEFDQPVMYIGFRPADAKAVGKQIIIAANEAMGIAEKPSRKRKSKGSKDENISGYNSAADNPVGSDLPSDPNPATGTDPSSSSDIHASSTKHGNSGTS